MNMDQSLPFGALKRFAFATLLAVLPVTPVLSDKSPIPIFTQAPSPRVLADILNPPRYRSIELKTNSSQAPDRPSAFGLLINFEFDSTAIVPTSRPLLDSVGQMLSETSMQQRTIVIEGHTDAIGSYDYNQQLSKRRAQSVKRYLISAFGIAPTRLMVEARGEREPHDWAKPHHPVNRRVQFRAYPDG